MPRKSASDSARTASNVLGKALTLISPPAHIAMQESDMVFWDSVVAEFPKVDWTPHTLEVAAKLAKTMADHDRNQDLLRVEGEVLVMDNDRRYTNPRHNIARDMTNMMMSLRRNLQMHAAARQPNIAEVGKARGQRKAVESGAIDDDLIARPN